MIAEIVDRLKAEAPALRQVEGAAEYAALTANPPKNRQPAAWVVPVGESAGASNVAMAVRQRVIAQVGVMLALGNLRDERGDAARRDLESVRKAVLLALLGWPPTGEHEPMEYARGDLLDLRDGVVWWQDRYVTRFHIRAV